MLRLLPALLLISCGFTAEPGKGQPGTEDFGVNLDAGAAPSPDAAPVPDPDGGAQADQGLVYDASLPRLDASIADATRPSEAGQEDAAASDAGPDGAPVAGADAEAEDGGADAADVEGGDAADGDTDDGGSPADGAEAADGALGS